MLQKSPPVLAAVTLFQMAGLVEVAALVSSTPGNNWDSPSWIRPLPTGAVWFQCQEACDDYICNTIESYHGGECYFEPDCDPVLHGIPIETTSIVNVDEDSIDLSTCTDFGECNQFGCWCTECTVYGCTSVCPQYEQIDYVCEINDYFCYDYTCEGLPATPLSDENLHCFLNTTQVGNDIVMNVSGNGDLDNTYFQCISRFGFEEGDPLCEAVGVKANYIEGKDYCQAFEDICDYSQIVGGIPQSTTELGCYDFLLDPAGEYWNQYDTDCVSVVSPQAASYSAVYDQACCYAYSIADFAVYDNELETDGKIYGVRVY